jgi:hypothetical protein
MMGVAKAKQSWLHDTMQPKQRRTKNTHWLFRWLFFQNEERAANLLVAFCSQVVSLWRQTAKQQTSRKILL